ncbi:MAG: RecQ family ATP-dependent DNA helicase [Dehalococcoidales bacterium]|nr:RecQ family ATP-dependent DNA helicase [Dehalococcoidales bacterium]
MNYNPDKAKQLLRQGTRLPNAEFRDNQEEAISHIVENRGRLLLVQKTGWGKSNVYFIATKLLREAGLGPALLISPLLSLMRNQILQAQRIGIRAETIHSENKDDWDDIVERVKNKEFDILLISPERLANTAFNNNVLSKISQNISFLIVDEAHCISDWGHDFRPHYRLIKRMISNSPGNVRLLATTATANNRVMFDLETELGPNITTLRGDLNRPSLYLQTINLPQQSERLAWLATWLGKLPGSGIIYTLTKHDTKRTSEWLRSNGYNVEWYDSSREDRESLENALIDNKLKALVATTALGMGYDKPDLGFVVHYQTPGSVIAYYQQVGRAGRALDSAYGILLSGEEEDDINDYFIDTAFPTREEVRLVLNVLEQNENGLTTSEILYRVNIKQTRLEKTLQLLSLESPSPIAKDGSKWQLTVSNLSDGFWERAERLTRLRREEQAQMKEYANLQTGHMEFLIGALDGDTHGLVSPDIPPIPAAPDPDMVKKAVVFLKRSSLPIEPRLMWPGGGLSVLDVKGKIPAELRAEEGRVLCHWGDSGWGALVRQGKYHDGRYSDELVAACIDMIKEWNPQPCPTWVTCIPSLRHPELVPDFAERIAQVLGLPFIDTLEKTEDRPQQKSMENSSQQARNVDGSLEIRPDSLPEGPVFLVDDMVDSRWTITIAAYLLRLNGSGEVFPLVLANTGNR